MKGTIDVIQRRLVKWALCNTNDLMVTEPEPKNGFVRSKEESPICSHTELSIDKTYCD